MGYRLEVFNQTLIFAFNLKNLHAKLRIPKQRYEKQIVIVQVIEIADVMKVYRNYFQGRTKYMRATWEMYLAGCELHIQTPTFLIVLTFKQ